MTMIGRATNRHYLLFTGAARFRVDASSAALARRSNVTGRPPQ
jgi:hypothetical protein